MPLTHERALYLARHLQLTGEEPDARKAQALHDAMRPDEEASVLSTWKHLGRDASWYEAFLRHLRPYVVCAPPFHRTPESSKTQVRASTFTEAIICATRVMQGDPRIPCLRILRETTEVAAIRRRANASIEIHTSLAAPSYELEEG